MRHFSFLDDAERNRLFFREPQHLDAFGDLTLLGVSLGATLYSPGTRPHLADDIARSARRGVVSVVACLEDAIRDEDLDAAECNVVQQLRWLAMRPGPRPLIFVRVRRPDQIGSLMAALGDAAATLTGFVLPKFTELSGGEYLDALVDAEQRYGWRLLAMPVLESADVMYAESRVDALVAIWRLLDKHRQRVLAVRVGATDLSAQFGLRRSRELTIWDVRVVADLIADMVNVLGRADGGFIITGPVWEYFSGSERLFKPLLRESPFVEHDEPALRMQLIDGDLDALIREVVLDRANGLLGKTVIHPSHVRAVHALSVVSHEEYVDALDLVESGARGGVTASAYGNKMNESKPHLAWARRTMLRAHAFGVAREDVSYVDFLGAGLHAS